MDDPGAREITRPWNPWLLILVVMLMIVPALFLVWARLGLEDRVEGIHISPEALVAPVGAVFDDARVPATVTIEWAPGADLTSPGFEGVVTAVYLSPGAVISDGDRVVQIDGIDRIAVRSAAPFFRRLTTRDSGSDVEALQAFLRRTGRLEAEADGVYGSTTVAAVKRLEGDLGVDKPTGTFDPAFLVWLPSDRFEIGTVLVAEANSAPSLGSPIAQARTHVAAAEVAFNPAAVHSVNPLIFLAGDIQVPLTAGGNSMSDNDLRVLSNEIDPDVTSLEGFVALSEPLAAWQVPTTAVVVGESGGLCVWLAVGNGVFEAAEVEIGTSDATGATLLVNGVGDGDHVLVNPFEVLENPSCP